MLDYENVPGEHCGSAAMRNLIRHYCGLDLSEEAAFGLGSGIDLLFLESPENEPAILAFGRSITLEIDLAAALGIDYREARIVVPDLVDESQPGMADRAAALWTEVAGRLGDQGHGDLGRILGRCSGLLGDIHGIETQLFEGLEARMRTSE